MGKGKLWAALAPCNNAGRSNSNPPGYAISRGKTVLKVNFRAHSQILTKSYFVNSLPPESDIWTGWLLCAKRCPAKPLL